MWASDKKFCYEWSTYTFVTDIKQDTLSYEYQTVK